MLTHEVGTGCDGLRCYTCSGRAFRATPVCAKSEMECQGRNVVGCQIRTSYNYDGYIGKFLWEINMCFRLIMLIFANRCVSRLREQGCAGH